MSFFENKDSSQLPIAVFDSGVGGLTVLKELVATFPRENFLYLGDTARLPYGSKSAQTIRLYLEQNIRFLLEQKVKAIVVACNSASSVLEKNHCTRVPIYEVIGPGAKTACLLSTNKKIGVIATRATVGQQSYPKAIKALEPNAQVYQQACPLLVPLVEEAWTQDPLTNLIVYRYLSGLKDLEIDTLILGCTHYPALKESIFKVMGNSVSLVESGQAICREIEQDIARNRLAPNPVGKGDVHLLTTDLNEQIQITAENILSPVTPHCFSHVNLT